MSNQFIPEIESVTKSSAAIERIADLTNKKGKKKYHPLKILWSLVLFTGLILLAVGLQQVIAQVGSFFVAFGWLFLYYDDAIRLKWEQYKATKGTSDSKYKGMIFEQKMLILEKEHQIAMQKKAEEEDSKK